MLPIIFGSLGALVAIIVGILMISSISQAPLATELQTVTPTENPSSLTASDSTLGHTASEANDDNTGTYWESEQN